MIRLAYPSLLLFGVLAIPLAALFLVRRQRRTVHSAYLFLWLQAVRPGSFGSRWQLEWLRLIWQLVILALWTLALTGPMTGEREGPHRQLLVLDNSVSMRAGQRMAVARESALSWIRPQTRTTIAVTSPVPRVLLLEGEPGEARSLLRAIQACESPGDFDELGNFLEVQGRTYHERAFFSDGCGPGSGNLPKSLGDTAWIRIGKEGAANRSVQSVRVEPLRRRLGWRISAEVANHGGLDEQITVHLLGAGGSQERQVRVGSGKSSPIEFVLDGPVSGKVQLRLSPADLFGLDDSALISLPDIPRASVTLVTPGKPNPFWKSAVVALGAWIDQPRSRTVISREWPPAQGVAPGGPFEVVILEGVRLRKQLVRGRYLLFDVQGASGVPTGSKRLNIGVWQVDRTHPVMRHVSLTELLVRSGRPLKPRRENGIHALARGPDGLLILAGRRRQLSIIQFAFTLEESNLAGLIAFPLILKNALLWFASDTLKVDVSAFAGGAESRLKVSAAGKRPRPGQIASRLRHHGAQLGLASAVLLMLGLLLPPLWVTRR